MNNINSTGIDKDNLKVIQTRKEYLDTLLN
jgi:hypothetical protein